LKSGCFFRMQEQVQTPAKILLAEDNPGDVFLVRRALALYDIDVDLTVIADGQTALGFVDRAEAGESECRPDLMLLDLNLPRAAGTRILERVQRSRRLAGVPVVVVTSSNSQADRDTAVRLGATHYFHKPTDLAGFMQLGAVVRALLQDSRSATAGN
jgi:chemotaxis family two-component system response regulator Rcp1